MESRTATWDPTGTAEILAGTPPGGGQDRAARALRDALVASGVPGVEVRNVPGRGGGVAWGVVADRRGDRRLLAISSPTLVTNAIHDPSEVPLDAVTHLAVLCTEYLAFVVAPDGPEARTQLADGRARVAVSTALGNVNHVALAAAASSLGTEPRRLEVEAFGSARTAVGRVASGASTLAVVSAASVLPDLDAGAVRVDVVTAPRRMPGPLDAVATWRELGVECVFGTWRGVVAPPDLPDEATVPWHAALTKAVRTPSWERALAAHVWSPFLLVGDEARAFVDDEERRLRAALRDLGIVDG